MSIVTERLELIPATEHLLRAAQQSDTALAEALGARLADAWPPEFYEETSLAWTLDQLAKGPEQVGWLMYFFVVREARVLIGYGGYKGAPAGDGTVEIGYSIVTDHQRQGYAAEATRGLVVRAFSYPQVSRVVAETLPDLVASIGVLEKLGFSYIGAGAEEGVVRYELSRSRFATDSSSRC